MAVLGSLNVNRMSTVGRAGCDPGRWPGGVVVRDCRENAPGSLRSAWIMTAKTPDRRPGIAMYGSGTIGGGMGNPDGVDA